MHDYEYWSQDRAFGLKLTDEQISSILSLCAQSGHRETGGILVGYYTRAHNCAIVTDISSGPSDSRSGTTWFFRGVKGLQSWLDRLWNRKKRRYYLGEWHFHPDGAPNPSSTDIKQMTNIAESEDYGCSEPVLLIIGGNPASKWNAKVFVFPRRERQLELKRTRSSP